MRNCRNAHTKKSRSTNRLGWHQGTIAQYEIQLYNSYLNVLKLYYIL